MAGRHETVLGEVEAEMEAQLHRWGEQNHAPLYWLGIVGEEFGEAAKEAIEGHFYWSEGWRKELLHTAATALSAIESYDRNERAGRGGVAGSEGGDTDARQP